MKHVITAAVLAFGISIPAMAQYSSGKILATGGLGFESMSDKFSPTSGDAVTISNGTLFGINLQGGYFIQENIAVGVSVGYNSLKSEVFPDDTALNAGSSSSIINYGLFGRYYMPLTDNFAFFGQLGVGMLTINSKTISGGTETENDPQSGLDIGLGAGFSYKVSDMVFLEMNFGVLGYNSLSTDNAGGTMSTNTFGLDANLGSLSLGAAILL